MQLSTMSAFSQPGGAMSPAQVVAQNLQWLADGSGPVSKVEATGIDSVTVTVPDDDRHDEGWMADLAYESLRQSIDGVKLLYVNQDGRPGESQGFSGDELYDLIGSLPYVSDYAEISWDVDGDGTVGEDEAAHVVQAGSEYVSLLAPVLRPEISGRPVVFTGRDI